MQNRPLEQIINIIKEGEKFQGELKLGAEFEHIVVWKDTMKSVSYYEEQGIEDILKALLEKGYEAEYEGDYLIALKKEAYYITLEPGGQLEISVVPCSTIESVQSIYFQFLEEIIPIMENNGQLLLAIGYHPKSSIKEIPFNPKVRYQYMSNYLKDKGTYSQHMMKGTAAIQVSIDYRNEEDFIKKFKVANFLSPLLHLITDNSPRFEGEDYLGHGLRSVIWQNTDKDRSGVIPGVMNERFGYEAYAKYILGIPPILMKKEGQLIETGNQSIGEVLKENDLTGEEIEHLLTMVFPDVRVKRYIEIRVGDSLPYPYNFAYIALLKGIFYDETVLNYLYKLANGAEGDQIEKAKRSMHKNAFKGWFFGKTIYDFIRILFDLSKKGLTEEEIKILKPLETLIISRKNLSLLMKEDIEKSGLQAIEFCGLNQWVRREKKQDEDTVISRISS
ncbi:Glutamate--cysteine ligase [Alkaliphilus metalliredigens QYMF]|uniref:Glutamate--cysteine ligase n=1 Tax=Alkaliphilus metalliredigens (strain QYMF) TaxID=293826 RepID=A6TWY9_ALKMQ|nr:glutamate-cysteine ligase family protein [Alkaliphilus metalliredigens]ABR50707.1 Glutamate--cysteine ligase [Alkaliphilus metalliredigens QYMF]